jgi:tetratricopeptide (TPR) repeat protein
MYTIRFLTTSLTFLLSFLVTMAQPGAEIEVKKPKKYENRKLASEKTGEKKFTIPRKLYQNTVTHYNYYFNANNRLNDLVNSSKTAYKDDYAQLLPFYNYTLEQTSQNKQELDSIIYKCTAGILLHDLRNSWIDNMYLLMAKAYFFRNDLDSAGLTLQYLNFSYAPKESGGYDKPIGSNASNETGEFSISTKEKNSIWTKLTSRPPSRNESFIWQIRNHIEKNELPEASGVIEILRHDPNFPKRLETDLHEAMAYWFYKQQAYDSAGSHLSRALNEAANNQEKARWEFLIAQMYQLSNKYDEAIHYYDKSITHTTDPVMDVYARLNSIRINRSENKDFLQQNIDALLKMAHRDKYVNYRDIIYYAAANVELERNNYVNAKNDLLNSVKYSINNPAQRSQSFLLLADLNYDLKSYVDAYNYYDSTDLNVLSSDADKERVTLRKPHLKTIAQNTTTVIMQDSLQALAKLPEDQRDAIIKKQVKLLRKAQGLKEEDTPGTNTAVKQVPDLFADNNKSTDFYFYNSAAKARGFSEFRARWGERPNVDNWRRKSALDRQVQRMSDVDDVPGKAVAAEQGVSDNSYEGLQQNIPTTPEKIDASNKSILEALFSSGQTFMNKLEEYPAAILVFEDLLNRFPNSTYHEEVLFNLIYAYEKTGDKLKSNQYKNKLVSASPQNKFAKLVTTPPANKNNVQAAPATKKYEQIYNLFIEGYFDEAKNQKKVADSAYGNSFWTPQLLFIESIYYIKQKEDTTAIKVLTDLSTLYSKDPMAARAKTMIDVLKRRKEIEDYLTKLEVTRNEDTPTPNNSNPPATTVPPPARIVTTTVPTKDTTAAPTKTVTTTTPTKDTTTTTAKTVNTTTPTKDTTTTPAKIVTTPTPTKDTIPTMAEVVTTPPPTKETTSAQARDTSPTPAIRDSVVVKTEPATAPAEPKVKKDTVVAPPAVVVKNFSFVATEPHYVVVLLDKVDPVYASEARNAFNRFNKEKYYNQKIEISGLKLNDQFNLVLQGPFADANAAIDYIDNVRPVAKSRILPWLTAEKYSFLVISNANLSVLKADQDMDSYKLLIQKAIPGKF